MRLFKRYTPGMIAKHVSRLFKGRIYIYGIGKFEFDNGKLVLPEKAERRHFQTVKEVNQEIMRLRCAYAQARIKKGWQSPTLCHFKYHQGKVAS